MDGEGGEISKGKGEKGEIILYAMTVQLVFINQDMVMNLKKELKKHVWLLLREHLSTFLPMEIKEKCREDPVTKSHYFQGADDNLVVGNDGSVE